ncbi:MAG: 6-carboxytetrahydropterin synthase [Sedimentisphaerales bacterium]|nr:6-carboxytetrahydropterin synthase [Sedimentisphaerales bacterium]
MFEISVETHFYASHELALPDGSKEPSHYHNWSVTADVSSENLNNMGIVMNFHKLRELLENITSKFNKKALNSIKYFQKTNPSAENVAKFIFEKLEPELPDNVKLECVSVVEEPFCTAKFRR